MKISNFTYLSIAAILLAAIIITGCTTAPAQPAITPTPATIQQKDLTVFAAASLTGLWQISEKTTRSFILVLK